MTEPERPVQPDRPASASPAYSGLLAVRIVATVVMVFVGLSARIPLDTAGRSLLLVAVLCGLALTWCLGRRSGRGAEAMPEPSSPATQVIPVDLGWTLERCAGPFQSLTPGQELFLYDADHPSLSDPGAFLRVQRRPEGGWLCKAANHGWSSDWTRAELAWLQSALHRNRDRQGAGMQLGVAVQEAREGEK